jgi:hypothetical protein
MHDAHMHDAPRDEASVQNIFRVLHFALARRAHRCEKQRP